MASDDFSGVTVAFDAASYVKGATMTLTVTGQNKHTSDGTTTHETVIVTATVQSPSGVTTSVQSQPVDVATTTPGGVTNEDVTLVSASDGSARVYTPKAGSGGHSLTAVA